MTVRYVPKEDQTPATEIAIREPATTVVRRVIKGDTYIVVSDSERTMEDEFTEYYLGGTSGNAGIALQPPYDPRQLKQIACTNNMLLQCVQAMEVNVDGTGHEFVPAVEGAEISQSELDVAKSFFDEPYPGVSMVTLRRTLRTDLESVGYGFVEVLRTVAGDIAAMRRLDVATMRLCRLEDPVRVTHRIMRNGKEVELTVMERPRRFMQLIGGKSKQFYKQFGSGVHVSRSTGEVLASEPPVDDRATEVIYFKVGDDPTSPYGVPRWINQLPSAIGSRKAEEANLEYFDAGGMPPAIIFLTGGSLVAKSAQDLRGYLQPGKNKGRAVVVEVASTSGSLDSSGAVNVKVERFGSEATKDAMWKEYDKACEEHVRVGFRIPPLFVGKASDYNFATAMVAYQTAEAQVFLPERNEFDQIINTTIIKSLGLKTLRFKSLPITLKSTDDLFTALGLISGKVPDGELVDQVNKAVGTSFKALDPEGVRETAKPAITEGADAGPAKEPATPPKAPDTKVKPQQEPDVLEKADRRVQVLRVVRKSAEYIGAVDSDSPPTEQEMVFSIAQLSDEEKQMHDKLLANYVTETHSCGH